MSRSGDRRRDNDRLGAVLREAREKQGLSQRQLAQRMRITGAAVSQAEKGADIRHDTLQDYLRALPGLTPAELLQAGEREIGRTRRDAWTYYRNVMGIEADLIERDLIVLPERGREDRFRCVGLRSIRNNPADLRLLDGLENVAFMGARPLVEKLEAARRQGGGAEELVRSRVLERREGRLLHRLVAPADLAREGLTYSWERSRDVGVNWIEDARDYGRAGISRVHAGFGHRVTLPVRRLRLRLYHPPGYWPGTEYLRVWPLTAVPDPRVRDFSEQVHPEGLELRRDRRRRMVSLSVEHPLVDWSYNIGWVLPSKPGP